MSGEIEKAILEKLDKIIEQLETMNYMFYSVFGQYDEDPRIECPKCHEKVIPNNLNYCPKCKFDLAPLLKQGGNDG